MRRVVWRVVKERAAERSELRPGGHRRQRTHGTYGGRNDRPQQLDRPASGRLRRCPAQGRATPICRGSGPIEQFGKIVARNDVDHVFIALPLARYSELPDVYRALEESLVEVQLVPDLPQLAGMRIRSLEIDEVPFLSLRGNPHYGWRKTAKRAMDVLPSPRRRWCCCRRCCWPLRQPLN